MKVINPILEKEPKRFLTVSKHRAMNLTKDLIDWLNIDNGTCLEFGTDDEGRNLVKVWYDVEFGEETKTMRRATKPNTSIIGVMAAWGYGTDKLKRAVKFSLELIANDLYELKEVE
jgi:hypothetical protein